MPQRDCTIFLLFVRTNSYPSRAVRVFAGGPWTHVAISTEGPAGPYYGFARRNPAFPFPAGLVLESPGKGYYALQPEAPCCVCALRVSETSFRWLCARLERLYRQRDHLRYNLIGAVSTHFGIPLHRNQNKFCSEFVAEMLEESSSAHLDKQPALCRPMDLFRLDGLAPVYSGLIGQLRA